MSPVALVGLLGEPRRLRAVAAIVLGADSLAKVADYAGLDPQDAARAVQRLRAGGLVTLVDHRLSVDIDVFTEAARSVAVTPEPEDHGVTDPAVAAVLRSFVRDGRLVSIPATRGKRLIVLEHIVIGFEPGVRYDEREVNAVLRAWHEDYAALRRYLVDEDLLAREAGVYWRTGGRFDLG